MKNLSFSKNIGATFTASELSEIRRTRGTEWDKRKDRAFITLLGDDFENKWFVLLLNDRHMKFDAEFTMEFCRENFGHLHFGISSGEHALMGCAVRDNL